ncbi:hypothetical protein Aph01nite_16700 [Acrocarpospora phusangensis]|uniref:Uncharacterized protein n=1 Tax=Acrocarpospora phusangensis TaxID=1070424 RepID=A0A919UP76_9ACTN|nr:hypothetical protein [Acrocarpospora phusangensis]GIH23360.1 hypothetical protein Aph01nite_16700 [Acrocarpospora phusangensis]
MAVPVSFAGPIFWVLFAGLVPLVSPACPILGVSSTGLITGVLAVGAWWGSYVRLIPLGVWAGFVAGLVVAGLGFVSALFVMVLLMVVGPAGGTASAWVAGSGGIEVGAVFAFTAMFAFELIGVGLGG